VRRLNLLPFGPESGPEPSQGDAGDTNPAESLHTDIAPQSSHSQLSTGFTKSFGTHLVPESDPDKRAHPSASAGGGQGAGLAADTRERASTAPTLTDLRVLWGGRERLLRVTEVAEMLGVGAWRIYQVCETGELPHVRINNSIRVRPKDLEVFIASRVTVRRPTRPHRRRPAR
jgi:excisionase family DNA binding protein